MAGPGHDSLKLAQNVGTIQDIIVEGTQRIEPDTVKSYLLIQEGDSFDPARIDRSLKSLFATGLFADVTLRRQSDTLVVNAKADRGEIRVEAIDALGRVIKGFAKDDCMPIRGDKVRHVVSWKGGANCHPLQARPIRLRFYLKQASLYSFEFQIRRNHFVPFSFRQ